MSRNRSRESYAASGRVGGLRTAALMADGTAHTQPARDARLEKFKQEIREALPHLTDDAEITRRALLLRKADMQRLAIIATGARQRAAQARREAAEAEHELAEMTAAEAETAQ